MQVKTSLRIFGLAAMFAVPFTPLAIAGDHAGNQWQADGDNRRVFTFYEQPNPYLAQLERDAYRADLHRVAQNQGVPSWQGAPYAAE